jgi:hypothetical protein
MEAVEFNFWNCMLTTGAKKESYHIFIRSSKSARLLGGTRPVFSL